MAAVEVVPVRADRLDALGSLFAGCRSTRHCWCTAFCSTSWQFARGWYGGGNRRRFESLAVTEQQPMGVLALRDEEPVGWCACGPRARYAAALDGRSRILADRPREEDHDVWLIACLVLRPAADAGVVRPLLRGAVALAWDAGASAIEAWPLAVGVRRRSEVHVGREGVFTRLGFARIGEPEAGRVLLRLESPRSSG